MGIRILKAGVACSFRDKGRFGYQHLGIGPCGAMDTLAMKVANALVGNHLNEAVLEMHFPASQIEFQRDALICITGASFQPIINALPIPLHQPVYVRKGAELRFQLPVEGARAYLSVQGGFSLTQWLRSCSTDVHSKTGGHLGRLLQTGDVINLKQHNTFPSSIKKDVMVLPFSANMQRWYTDAPILCLPSTHYHLLTPESKNAFEQTPFQLTTQSNRMGYRLQGTPLHMSTRTNQISSGVVMGSVQLLPGKQCIVLMADHQTTGGYPVIAHVIAAELPRLAQLSIGAILHFKLCDTTTAVSLLQTQHRHILQVQNASTFRLNQLANANGRP